MLDIVAKAIDQFYIKKDFASFKASCKKKLELCEELQDYIKNHKFKLTATCDDEYSSSREWCIHFSDYKKGNFEVSYKTILKISKVAPLFYIEHKFAVKNMSKDLVEPMLRNGRNKPYTSEQMGLHNKIFTILSKSGHYELQEADLYEVVEGFKMPDGVTVFGPGVTVDLLLFVDVLDICNRPLANL